MADQVNYIYCDVCTRVFDTQEQAKRCRHDGPQRSILDVAGARLAGEYTEGHQQIARMQGRIK
jgi:hypothetical protein